MGFISTPLMNNNITIDLVQYHKNCGETNEELELKQMHELVLKGKNINENKKRELINTIVEKYRLKYKNNYIPFAVKYLCQLEKMKYSLFIDFFSTLNNPSIKTWKFKKTYNDLKRILFLWGNHFYANILFEKYMPENSFFCEIFEEFLRFILNNKYCIEIPDFSFNAYNMLYKLDTKTRDNSIINACTFIEKNMIKNDDFVKEFYNCKSELIEVKKTDKDNYYKTLGIEINILTLALYIIYINNIK